MAITQWFEARLHFRVPEGRHRATEGDVATGIQVTHTNDPVQRHEAAYAEAERAFRDLGLGAIMDKKDQPGARISIEVFPA